MKKPGPQIDRGIMVMPVKTAKTQKPPPIRRRHCGNTERAGLLALDHQNPTPSQECFPVDIMWGP